MLTKLLAVVVDQGKWVACLPAVGDWLYGWEAEQLQGRYAQAGGLPAEVEVLNPRDRPLDRPWVHPRAR